MSKEYQIGEVFEYKGKKLKVVEGNSCQVCCFESAKTLKDCEYHKCMIRERKKYQDDVHFEEVTE